MFHFNNWYLWFRTMFLIFQSRKQTKSPSCTKPTCWLIIQHFQRSSIKCIGMKVLMFSEVATFGLARSMFDKVHLIYLIISSIFSIVLPNDLLWSRRSTSKSSSFTKVLLDLDMRISSYLPYWWHPSQSGHFVNIRGCFILETCYFWPSSNVIGSYGWKTLTFNPMERTDAINVLFWHYLTINVISFFFFFLIKILL